MSEDLSNSSSASTSHEPMDSTSPKELPSASSSRQVQEPSVSHSSQAQVPSASNSRQAQEPSVSNSSQAQVPAVSNSSQAQVPSASTSSQAQISPASTSNVEPAPSTSSQTPSTSTSSQILSTPSTSSLSQVPTNLTLDLLPSTSNPSTSDNQGTKDKSIDPLKLKILCFHGYMQDAKKFEEELGAFRELVSKYAYVVFVSAPHIVALDPARTPATSPAPADEPAAEPGAAPAAAPAAAPPRARAPTAEGDAGRNADGSNRSWWFNAEDNTFGGGILGGPAIGFQEAISAVIKAVDEHGPFDGFMGFSQGACLVGILAAMQQKKLSIFAVLPYRFKFAIMVSGFLSGSLVHRGFYDELIDIPSLHVYGEGDSTIPKGMSESLINKFRSPVIIEHSGGHYVPTAGPAREAYEDFLADMYQQRLIDRQEAERTAAWPALFEAHPMLTSLLMADSEMPDVPLFRLSPSYQLFRPQGGQASQSVADAGVADAEVANVEVANVEMANVEMANVEMANAGVADVEMADSPSDDPLNIPGPSGRDQQEQEQQPQQEQPPRDHQAGE